MSVQINTVGVIGAGVMGSAIAAHLAGAGLRVHLLDIVPPGASDPDARNRLAADGLKKALATTPAPFFTPEAARLISVGNLEDHLTRVSECDLVIEAVVESLPVKQALFKTISPHLSATALLASNTSGLSIAQMSQALPEALRSRFLVMHFFNPVRYMKLLELVAAPETSPETMQRAEGLGELLGKGIVFGKDTTNFVANRIGVYSLMFALHAMLEDKLTVEEVDVILGPPVGRPKSAAFKTADLVGIDTLIHVASNCYDSLPNDEERETFRIPDFLRAMVKAGATGRKAGAGFYKKEGKDVLALDYEKGVYVALTSPRFDSVGAAKKAPDVAARLRVMATGEDRAAKFAWRVLSKTLCYAAHRVGEIADDIVNIDRAMRWGFNWDLGPFEVWDALGVETTAARMKQDGLTLPAWIDEMLQAGQTGFYAGTSSAPQFYVKDLRRTAPVPVDPKVLRYSVIKNSAVVKSTASSVVRSNAGASLVDLGDGVLGVEVHTKMNTLDSDVISMFSAAVPIAEGGFRAILLANDGEHFGAGANLMMIVGAALQKKWDEVDGIINALQRALQGLKYARVPVVAAPCQYTLGGGAEVALAADACQAYAETYMGLVEVGVGLLPAGGGCLRMVERYTADLQSIEGADLLPPIATASLNIAMAKTSTSAADAKVLRYLRPSDGITLNRDHLTFEAKQRALGLAGSSYRPPLPQRLRAAGYDASKTIGAKIWGMVEGGFASEHDAVIARKVAHVLCGGNVAQGTEVDDQHYLDLEREAFLSLCAEPKTQARIEHMLKTGAPLRN